MATAECCFLDRLALRLIVKGVLAVKGFEVKHLDVHMI